MELKCVSILDSLFSGNSDNVVCVPLLQLPIRNDYKLAYSNKLRKYVVVFSITTKKMFKKKIEGKL